MFWWSALLSVFILGVILAGIGSVPAAATALAADDVCLFGFCEDVLRFFEEHFYTFSWREHIPLAAEDIFDILLTIHDLEMIVLARQILSEFKLANSGLYQFAHDVPCCDNSFQRVCWLGAC